MPIALAMTALDMHGAYGIRQSSAEIDTEGTPITSELLQMALEYEPTTLAETQEGEAKPQTLEELKKKKHIVIAGNEDLYEAIY